jgi:hypothetical protein
VDTRSLAHPTRTVFVHEQLSEEIAELTGIEYRMLSRAFAGVEKKNRLCTEITKSAQKLRVAACSQIGAT